jgi:hypothetical protein
VAELPAARRGAAATEPARRPLGVRAPWLSLVAEARRVAGAARRVGRAPGAAGAPAR